jgi:D-alanyl-lipoteichoic acid acyltransferase DltB (MBOAT superfamily)
VAAATAGFAVQIYCDFSGYTDIARGVAKCLGFDLILNFNQPYFARNPSEFWQRWHISLSSWLRDYLYIPLGGNRHGEWATYCNLMITMLLGGLWHGAAWNFVLWGAYQGAILCAYRALAPPRRRPRGAPRRAPAPSPPSWRRRSSSC